MSLLKATMITKKFKTEAEELHILRNINIEITNGTTTVITGESGCGKSTLLNIIGGLDRADSGSIEINGKNIQDFTELQLSNYRKNTIGFIFQFHYLLKDFTCIENVMLPFFMSGNSKKASIKKAENLLDRVNLSERKFHYPAQLSGGERQRAALARALINDPDLILADEPTGNLDEENSGVVEEFLFDMVNDFGKTLLLVTHDMDLAKKIKNVYQLQKGELIHK